MKHEATPAVRRYTVPLMLVLAAAVAADLGHDASVRHRLVTQVIQR
ncbi:hypothetical protein [Solimonas terrae]|uniref:Uncharacterized protein n=1 Tax=Solimonas terrae TaxID=1396819 RepID=A0A6M2BS12_9GAMM|nr:hypothetical protein [Solimonas terrae]NGY04787.1 hypothetical protein [Solimonas terrae]